MNTELEDLYRQIQLDPAFEDLQNSNFVPGTGPMNPLLMIVAEAPGSVENARRVPFVGKAGEALKQIFTTTGIDLSQVFMTNLSKYWPHTSEGHRGLTEEELLQFKEYLFKEIDIVNPLIVGLCGKVPIKCLFPQVPSVRYVNGKLFLNKFVPLFNPFLIEHKPEKIDEVISGYQTVANLIKILSKD